MNSRRTGWLLGVLLLLGACAAPPDTPTSDRATLDVGQVRGTVDGDVVRFRGVPYAAPPTGDLRWAPPAPVPPWTGERDATRSGPACAQTAVDAASGSTAEDCLHLDVTAPSRLGRDRPVMVLLHGGGFSAGAGSEIDTRRMAAQGDVVVVSVDFRLGVFGYLALPGMNGGGTFGLADQQEALRFVRRNAAAFGGDPRNVTLFGQSGGGIATCGQLASPTARGLFDRAIIQSGGPCLAPIPAGGVLRGTPEVPFFRPLPDVERDSAAVVATLGCTDPATALTCARGLPVDRLLAAGGAIAAAALGGPLLPRTPAEGLRNGTVPVLSGHTRDEARVNAGTAALLGTPITDAEYPALIEQGFGDRAPAVLEQYPLARYGSGALAWSAVYTDRTYACPQLLADDTLSASVPVFAYEFRDRTAPPFIPFPPGALEPGASHASELAYLFEVRDKPIDIQGRPVPLTAAQLALGSDMIRTWTSFARTGTLDAQRWSPQNRVATAFGGDTPTSTPWDEHRCDFWAGELG